MTDFEKREAARQFINKWNGKGKEDEDDRSFWLDIIQRILGIDDATDRVEFQKKVIVDGNTKRIDAYIPETKVIIEQKSLGIALDKKGYQSGGIELTPYEQAKRYNDYLPSSEKARWIITSNFSEIWVYDMDTKEPKKNITVIKTRDLQNQFYLLDFLVHKDIDKITKEKEISIKAGDIVGLLYDALLKQYNDSKSEKALKSLNVLCVRLVFCFYAEDAGVFGRRLMFHDYLEQFDSKHFRDALIKLFNVLNQKPEERDPYLDDDLAAFPYVNGGLFEDDKIEIPQFTDEIRTLILEKASEDFDWSEISPTIFGAVFESTLNPETRRKGGMHYTSIENIHKVIDPLFLNDLRAEFEEKKNSKQKRNEKLEEFRTKLGSLKFLDPACGSGNFLTETYISLRKLENEALDIIHNGQTRIEGTADNDTIRVQINQFYGIEINDFAVTVAKTALWIAESQMLKETERIFQKNIDFLPLTTNASIVEANALRINWNDVVPANELHYIISNPPFVGARVKSEAQKEDLIAVFGKSKGIGDLDYVGGWYKQASDYMLGTRIETALVSTNSITQGEQPAILWNNINKNLSINYAYRTFRWDSEASIKAHVHCVIVSFSYYERKKKIIYDDDIIIVDSINAYLLNEPNVIITSRSKPICNVPKMDFGSMPNDDNGRLSKWTKEEKDDVVKKYPAAEKLFKQIVGAEEFIKGKERYCLWLKGVSPIEYIDIPPICKAIKAVEEYRKNSTRAATRKLAEKPMLFGEIRQPSSKYLLIPGASSKNRNYIPIGFVSENIISTNANFILPDATLYQFGVLTSKVHMKWMRAVCGRLKSDPRYSNDIVYNNFPWPSPTDEQKAQIERTAQAILDARSNYSECSFAKLYGDKFSFFTDLKTAHQNNDNAVMEAYGLDINTSDAEIVAFLMKRYQELTK